MARFTQLTWQLTRPGRRRRVWSPALVSASLFALASFAGTSAAAQPGGARLLAVSRPPASLLPTDPAQGLVYAAPTNLASAEVAFNAAGGPVSLVYLALSSHGTGYLTFDDGPDPRAPGGVMVVRDLRARADLTFDPARDRLITGRAAGLKEPKDLVLLEELGLLIVADFAGADLKVFDALGAGDLPPLFTVAALGSSSGEPRRPWGLAYDAAADRLFVGATDGALLVYDAFLERRGGGGPDRVVTPTWQERGVSHNLHELIYLPERDRIVVTDVGAATTGDQPGFDRDGALFVIDRASRADGPTAVTLRVAGPASQLGNPVSLVRQGNSVFVAENERDLLLRFDHLLGRRGALDLAPDAALSIVKPESLVVVP